MKKRLVILLLSLSSCAWAADIKISVDREDGIYSLGEDAVWQIETVHLDEGDQAPQSAKYQLLSNGLQKLDEGTLEFSGGHASYSATRDDPGTLLLVVEAAGVEKAYGGAAFDPSELSPAIPRPEDFEQFWAKKRALADTIPLNPVLTEEASPVQGVQLWQLTVDNINESHVRGQLARPDSTEKKLPALLIVQWAGVYPLKKSWSTNAAEDGWLVLNIQAHDIPLYESQTFYDELKSGPLNRYNAIGNDDRETSYFLRMYLGCYQAVRYLTSRPDWDGKTLVVRGSSQGGMQALVTAALCNEVVTAAIAKVPAGSDQSGPLVGRKPSWPGSFYKTTGKDEEKVHKTSAYFDVINFCPDILCPTLIGMGLADTTCPAPGIFIAANEMPGPVELITMPSAGHKSTRLNPHAWFSREERVWLEKLGNGEVPLADIDE
ncbi:acetylxylan esterase [Puniceicoccus vermicola]|uniref:Acetylxylan esterase n=1 Tax=Puniceicoccus vermicola TaxID=388746 RepID=A0A7X1E446_9BACT|nr:acetylxylan esterase [Puniceicoccus vermicola]MBC2600232.1 acetylxylan esterase [Puniceicoccus vermicola]